MTHPRRCRRARAPPTPCACAPSASQDGSDWGVILVLLSLSSQIGKGLQKEGVKGLPELSGESLTQYLKTPVWVFGLALDIGGALFGLAALGLLPISIFQPLSCSGLVVLALFSALYLKETLGCIEWFGVALCLAGVVAISLTLEAQDFGLLSIGWLQTKMGITMGCVAVAVVLLELVGRKAKVSPPNVTVVELVAGCQAGLCIGAGNAGLGSGLQFISVGTGVAKIVSAGFIVLGISFTGASPVFANRGYTIGRVVIITAYMTLVSLAAGVLIGVVVLDEPWPKDLSLSLLRWGGLLTIAVSVVLLNASDLLKHICPAADADDAESAVGTTTATRAPYTALE